ncbi:MAG: hypothetical protein ABSD09_04135 [Xanthobacteraceae bacterium]|jgi:hypothetical protein
MLRNGLITLVLVMVLSTCAGDLAVAGLQGPGPWFGSEWVWGNDTGGILPYSPEIRGVYRQMAAEHCARWHRLSHVTSVHPRYGDYVTFVCMDRPGVIH